MNFFKENNKLKREPTRRNFTKTSSNPKKVYWKISSRSSLVAIFTHWATLSTLAIGVVAMVVVTVLFYRENKGTYYKSKFLSPIALSKSIEEISESSQSTTLQNRDYTEYNPNNFNSSPAFVAPEVATASIPTQQDQVEILNHTFEKVQNVETHRNFQTGYSEEELVTVEELPHLTGLSGIKLAVPTLVNPNFEPKQPSDYVNEDKKSRWIGRFRVGAEVGFGLSTLNVRDARMDDSQVVGDVKVKPELVKSYGFVVQAQVLPQLSVGTGIYENSFRSEIIPRFLPDPTGSGYTWPPPEEEEHSEEEEHGSGQNVIQLTEGGYDIVTNAGVTHVSHDMDEDMSILSGSKEHFTYYTIPVNVNYTMRYRKINIEIGTTFNYNHLKHSYALFNVLDDNKFSTQKSDIIGLKTYYFSQSVQLGMQYKLTYNLSVGASFKYNYALSTMNESTPFNTRINSLSGMAGVYYNF